VTQLHTILRQRRKKDQAIDEKLKKIGIRSLRICGRDIAQWPMESARVVEAELNKSV
jgi:hypothetical protein